MPKRSLPGLRVLVTGASSGIGGALARELVRRGGRVLAMARREERLAKLAAELAPVAERSGGAIAVQAGDVTLPAHRRLALDRAVAAWDGLDILINNAGSGALGRFADAAPERLRRVMEVNFFAPAEFLREALPLLKRGRTPLVVNVGSVLGRRAVPQKSEYCAAKFALHGLSDALRLELARDGVGLLLMAPSTTASEFFAVAEGAPPQTYVRPRIFGAQTPEAVAGATVRAIEYGRREVVLSLGGKLLVGLERLCPALADWLLARYA